MKMTLAKSLVGLALVGLALTGASHLFAAADFSVSTFDSDLGSNPYGTNIWTDTTATEFVWTNTGIPAGSLRTVHDWPQAAPGNDWAWQEDQAHLRPWGTNGPGLDLRYYQSIDFDVLVRTDVSTTNLPLHSNQPYGGINVAVQGDPYWGNNPTNGVGWTYLATADLTGATTNGGWRHYSIPTIAFQYTLSELIFQFFNWGNSNNAMHTEVLVDNVKLIAGIGPPPTLQYTKANRGLNIWATGGSSDRRNFASFQDDSLIRMWAGSGAASYSFTIGAFPTEPVRTNLLVRMYLIANNVLEDAPDWTEANCIFTDLGVDVNGNAYWVFRWKTNVPNNLGQVYDPGSQVVITNPTPVGKWTLSFADDTHVTMTAPGGNSTSFQLGTNDAMPDISPAFMESTNHGVVYFGVFSSGTNVSDLAVDFAAVQISGPGVSGLSNNWLAETSIDPSQWVAVANPPYKLVATNNAWWVNWKLPDAGFFVQTNTVGVGVSNCWSTNHGLPDATIYATHKGLLVKPGDLPNTSRLFYRLSRPGY